MKENVSGCFFLNTVYDHETFEPCCGQMLKTSLIMEWMRSNATPY